jgi:hypothetical protein
MSVAWEPAERAEVETAVARFPLQSGRCAALARAVASVGRRRDEKTRGKQIKPVGAARFVVPKEPLERQWYSHTFAETHAHAVDALTGADGCASGDYLATHWEFPTHLRVTELDLTTVDPGIQEEP